TLNKYIKMKDFLIKIKRKFEIRLWKRNKNLILTLSVVIYFVLLTEKFSFCLLINLYFQDKFVILKLYYYFFFLNEFSTTLISLIIESVKYIKMARFDDNILSLRESFEENYNDIEAIVKMILNNLNSSDMGQRLVREDISFLDLAKLLKTRENEFEDLLDKGIKEYQERQKVIRNLEKEVKFYDNIISNIEITFRNNVSNLLEIKEKAQNKLEHIEEISNISLDVEESVSISKSIAKSFGINNNYTWVPGSEERPYPTTAMLLNSTFGGSITI
uniref:Mediator of RNA polymerase II transcription subunit 4 n=2 Tax=Strongyloides stercoralis TaxID=6248 RepID=A0AAF5D275_STRER